MLEVASGIKDLKGCCLQDSREALHGTPIEGLAPFILHTAWKSYHGYLCSSSINPDAPSLLITRRPSGITQSREAFCSDASCFKSVSKVSVPSKRAASRATTESRPIFAGRSSARSR